MDYLLLTTKMAVALVVLITTLRLMGKKEYAQIEPLDLIYMIMLGDLVGGMVHTTSIGVFPVIYVSILWSLFVFLFEYMAFKWDRLSRLAKGKPEVIIDKGVVLKDVLAEKRMREKEIDVMLRKQGIRNVAEVEKGYLETNGTLSVFTYQNEEGGLPVVENRDR